LIQTIVPTRPFGLAVYYSVAAERQVEAELPAKRGVQFYYVPEVLMKFKDHGGVANYYVSDAGLAEMTPTSPSKPAAWVILDRPNLIPPAERQKLESIAPIITSLAEAQNFAQAPLQFSTAQLTGDGFYDQEDRLIVLATNLTATDINHATLSLRGVADGQYLATDLFSQEQFNFTVADRVAAVPIAVTRWDTRVLAITLVAPAKP